MHRNIPEVVSAADEFHKVDLVSSEEAILDTVSTSSR